METCIRPQVAAVFPLAVYELQSHYGALQFPSQLQVRSHTFNFAETKMSIYLPTQRCARTQAVARYVFLTAALQDHTTHTRALHIPSRLHVLSQFSLSLSLTLKLNHPGVAPLGLGTKSYFIHLSYKPP